MSTIQREVVITGNASGLTNEIDRAADQIDKSMKKIHDGVSKGLAGMNVDDSITKKLSIISKQASDSYKDLEARATNLNKKTSDRIRFMQEELRMSERLSKEEKQRDQIRARHLYGKSLDEATDKSGNVDKKSADEAKTLFDARIFGANSKYADDRLKQEMMRQEFDQYRQEHHGSDKQRKEYHPLQAVGNVVGKTISATLAALGLASLFTIGGAVTKAISEGRALDESAGRFAGLRKGGKDLNYGYERLFEGGDVTGMGMKQSEFMEYSASVAKSRGNFGGSSSVMGGNKSLYNESVAELSIEKGYGLEQGKLAGYSTLLRAQASGKGDMSGNVQEMLSIFKKSKLFGIDKGDFALLGEKIDIQNKLNEEQVNQRERIDTTTSTQIMAAFGKVGGSAGDFRQGSVISTINQSLTNPGNDFKQAFLFNALRKANPNMSVTGMRIKQEEGIYGKGTLKTVMDELVKDFKGDMLTENVASMTGLSLHQAKVFGERYKSDKGVRSSIANIGTREGLGRLIDSEFSDSENMKRAKENTGVIQSTLAGVNTMFGKAGGDKMNKFKEAAATGDFTGLLETGMKDIVKSIVRGFEAVLGIIGGPKHQGFSSSVSQKELDEAHPYFAKVAEKYKKELKKRWPGAYDPEFRKKMGWSGEAVPSDEMILNSMLTSADEKAGVSAADSKHYGHWGTKSTETREAEILQAILNELKTNKNETFEQAVNKVYKAYKP